MLFPLISTIFGLFILYSAMKIMRRWLAKPNYRNKTVWITGASSGIGQYLAYEFSKNQASLIISARNVKQLERVKSNCVDPSKVKVVQLDMSDYSQIQKVTAEVIKQLEQKQQKLDVLVQNAGVSMRCLFKDYSFNNHIDLFNINVHGPFKHIQCAIKHMINNKSGQIVGITSLSGKLATSHRSSYAGTKSAFIALMDSLRSQLYEHNINVTNIMPGYVHTNLSKNALTSGDGQKLGFTDKNIQNGLKADYFAKLCVKAIYNKENELQISGMIFSPIAIALRNLCPDLLFFLMRRNAKSQAEAIQQKQN